MKTLAAGMAVVSAAMFSTFAAGTAQAAPICPGAGQPTPTAATVGGALEGLTVDDRGRAFTTDLTTGRVYRIDAPGAPAVPIATVPSGGAGALAWTPRGTLLVGYGADARVLLGDALRPGGIVEMDPNTGAFTPFAAGLSAANGLATARDGSVYATNDFGSLIGKVHSNGAVQPDWASFPSANGAVLGRDNEYLYVGRTFANPGVSRIPIANPAAPQSLLDLTGADTLTAPDGLTLDSADRPDWLAPDEGLAETLDNNGRNMWATFLTKELPPVIDSTFGTTGVNALAGISMAGTSVLDLAIQAPALYRSAAAYSGCAMTSDPIGQAFVKTVIDMGGGEAENMWGPFDSDQWREHDPYLQAHRLPNIPMYISSGSGFPGIHDTLANARLDNDTRKLLNQTLVGGTIEAATNFCTTRLAQRTAELGRTNITYNIRPMGTHSWGYWQDDLHDSWPMIAQSIGA